MSNSLNVHVDCSEVNRQKLIFDSYKKIFIKRFEENEVIVAYMVMAFTYTHFHIFIFLLFDQKKTNDDNHECNKVAKVGFEFHDSEIKSITVLRIYS